MSEKEKLARKIADAILQDVTDRRGWRQEWEGFDEDIQKEIKDTWVQIIKKELSA